MAVQHPCFISYRHLGGELAERTILHLEKALSNELQLLTGRSAYIDHARLRPGYKFDEKLATNLCQSACMVLVYSPPYFDRDHTYCAREFRAMQRLEKERLARMPGASGHGLILPIVVRGEEYLPEEIRAHIQYDDLSEFFLASSNLSRNVKFNTRIKTIAAYIADMWRRVDALDGIDCTDFRLPLESDLDPWLAGVLPSPQPFPGD
jgi:hypothetical protein